MVNHIILWPFDYDITNPEMLNVQEPILLRHLKNNPWVTHPHLCFALCKHFYRYIIFYPKIYDIFLLFPTCWKNMTSLFDIFNKLYYCFNNYFLYWICLNIYFQLVLCFVQDYVRNLWVCLYFYTRKTYFHTWQI